MSARDDQPVTVPPPAGEDDAYSATTKVGAMPADLMERLRAEGLLPEEPDANDRPTALPQQPSTSLAKRPTPIPPVDGDPLPQLYSLVPPAEVRRPTTKPPVRPTGPPEPLDSVETPIAFTKPPPSSLPPPKLLREDDDADEEENSEGRKETTGLTRTKAAELDAPAAAPPSKTTLYVIGALVVILLIVALLRMGR